MQSATSTQPTSHFSCFHPISQGISDLFTRIGEVFSKYISIPIHNWEHKQLGKLILPMASSRSFFRDSFERNVAQKFFMDSNPFVIKSILGAFLIGEKPLEGDLRKKLDLLAGKMQFRKSGFDPSGFPEGVLINMGHRLVETALDESGSIRYETPKGVAVACLMGEEFLRDKGIALPDRVGFFQKIRLQLQVGHAYCEFLREKQLKEHAGKEVKFKTQDGVELSGIHLKGEGCDDKSRTVIFFNGNGEYSQQNLIANPLISEYLKRGFNVFLFNYRGIDNDAAVTHDGLVSDGEAALEYVCKLGVPEDQVMIHGHSLGGGISAVVAARHKIGGYCSDRSFSSLTQEVRVLICRLAAYILRSLGWELDAGAEWDKISCHKWVVCHPQDSVIPAGARLAEALANGSKNTPIITMTEDSENGQVAHSMDFDDRTLHLYFEQLNKVFVEHQDLGPQEIILDGRLLEV